MVKFLVVRMKNGSFLLMLSLSHLHHSRLSISLFLVMNGCRLMRMGSWTSEVCPYGVRQGKLRLDLTLCWRSPENVFFWTSAEPSNIIRAEGAPHPVSYSE
jgi:hypothetical protein